MYINVNIKLKKMIFMEYKELFIEKYNYLYEKADLLNVYIMKDELIDAIEDVMISDKPLKEIKGYNYIENIVNDNDHMNKYYAMKEYKVLIKELYLLNQESDFIDLCKKVLVNINRRNISKNDKRKIMDLIYEYIIVATFKPYEEENNIIKYVDEDSIIDKDEIEINEFINYFSNSYIYNERYNMRKNNKLCYYAYTKGLLCQFHINGQESIHHFSKVEKEQLYYAHHKDDINKIILKKQKIK